MAYELAKTLFIGLGGTGAHTLIRTKALLKENYGEIPPFIKFLVLDTDSREKISIISNGEKIEFDTSEYFQITIDSVKKYCEANQAATKFFDKSIYKVKTSITEGAGQIRSCGRLAFIKQFETLNSNILPRTMASVRNWQAAMNPKYSFNLLQPVRIYVVFSVAGGTGAGSFIDFPLLLRGHMVPGEIITGIGLLPDIYSLKGLACKQCESNALTGITEYEFIADGVLTDVLDPEDPAIKIATPISNMFYKVDNQALYDSFVLVNNRSSNNIEYTDVPEISEFLSRSLFLFTASLGGNKASTLDNVNVISNNPHKGKQCRYLGLGTAEMYFDSVLVADYYALCYLDKLTDWMDDTPKEQPDYQQLADSCISNWQLQEDLDQNQVISAIISKLKTKIFNYSFENLEGNAEIIEGKHRKFIEESISELDNLIKTNLDELKTMKVNLLENFFFIDESENNRAYINHDGGVYGSKKLMEIILGRFNAMKGELENEVIDLKTKLSSLPEQFAVCLKDITDIESKMYIIPGRKEKKVELACSNYIELTNKEFGYIIEQKRRKAGILFYEHIIVYIKGILGKISTFEVSLGKVNSTISENIQKINLTRVIRPFTIAVHNKYFNKINVTKNDVLPVFNFEKVKFSEIVLNDYEPSLIYKVLLDYCKNLDKTKSFNKLGILDVITSLDREDQDQLISDLKSASGILRLIDKSESFPRQIQYDIGVPDLNHHVLLPVQPVEGKVTSPSFRTLLEEEFSYDKQVPTFVNLQDPKRIIVSAYESAAPAFAILNFARYQMKYESHLGVTLFSNKQWQEQIERLDYTIFPKNTDNAIMAWTLAILVTKVEQSLKGDKGRIIFKKDKASNYFIRSEARAEAGNNYLFDLSSSYRPKAYSIFEQTGISDEVLPEISNLIRQNISAYDEVLNILKEDPLLYINEYAQHMLDNSTLKSPAHSQTMEQLTKEHNFIKGFKTYDLIH